MRSSKFFVRISLFLTLGALALPRSVGATPTRPNPVPSPGSDAQATPTMKFSPLLQLRFQLAQPELGEDDGTKAAFRVKRARLKLHGHAYSPSLVYTINYAVDDGTPYLLDLFVEKRFERARLRLGQFKLPYSRQFLSSVGKLELVDRAILKGAFPWRRDMGIMLHDGFKSSPTFEWALGLFNGASPKPRIGGSVLVDPESGAGDITKAKLGNVPSRFEPAVAARIGYNIGERVDGYAEPDVKRDGLRVSVAASVYADLGYTDDQDHQLAWEADMRLKYQGLSLTGEYHWRGQGRDSGFDSPELAVSGFMVEGSYLLGDSYLPAARYARLDYEDGGLQQDEIALSMAVFFHGQKVKWVTDAAVLGKDGAGDSRSNGLRVCSQVQFSF